jgi:translocation and assembly module TamB
MRRVLTWVGALIGLAALLLAATAYAVFYTQGGLRFVVAHLPSRFGTAEVRIEQVSGTLATGVHAERVLINQRHVYLRFDDVYTRVHLSALSWRTLVSPQTRIGAAYIRVKAVRPLPVVHPKFLPWGLKIRVTHAQVGAVQLILENGRHLEGTGLRGAVQIGYRDLHVTGFALRMGQARYRLAAALRAARPLQLTVGGTFTWRPPRQPPWQGRLALHGNIAVMTIQAHLSAPFSAALHGTLREQHGRWSTQSELGIRGLDLRAWHRTGRFGRIRAQLALTGGVHGFRLGGTVNPRGLRAGTFHVQLDGRYRAGVLSARRFVLAHPASGTVLSGAGHVHFGDGRPDLQLQGTWQRLRWPLNTAARVHSPRGTFTLTGRLPYALAARGLAQVGTAAPVPVTLGASLTTSGLAIEHATLHMLGGRIEARGMFGWVPLKRWSLHLIGIGIDPAQLRSALRGRLSFALSATGEGFGAAAPLHVRLERLSGQVRGQPASGSGAVSRDHGVWTFQRLRLDLGRTHLAAAGRLARHMHLRFALRGDLRLISRGDRGTLTARGSIDGSRRAPRVNAWLEGSDLHIGANSLAALRARIDFDPRPQHRSQIRVQLRELRSRYHLLRSLQFDLHGPAAALRATLEVNAPGLHAAALASGSFAQGVFAGEVTSFNVNGPQSLHLQLRAPAQLTLSRVRRALGALCLDGTPGALCTGATWTPGGWSAYVSASKLPLATLTAGMTPAVEYQGTLGASLELTGSAGSPVQGTLRMTLSNGVLSRRLVSGTVEHTSIGSGLLTAIAGPRTIHARASLTAGAIGTFQAVLNIRRGAADWRALPLTGSLQARTARLNLVSLYLPGVDAVSGVLLAHATVGGTIADPRLHGAVKIVDASADLYRTNLQMHRLSLTAQLVQSGLTFVGSAQVGKGTLQATGTMGWRGAAARGEVHLRGTDLRVVDLPEARIDASPQLDFRLIGHRIDATGKVLITHARIAPRNFRGAVRTSSDQVIVGAESSSVAHRYHVVSVITFDLGNDVDIQTMGLTGQLSGQITVRSGLGQGTTATGELFVRKGQYSAYARRLAIQTGRLFFRGGPLDNPGIEIRAVRRYPDVTAGINVSGTLKQPQVSFFSNPPLSQSQIMSLILSGGGGSLQALQTTTGVQSRQSTAANELLAQGGAILAQQLGSRIGLPDVSLQTDMNNQTSIVLGKYLSPRLYVSYGVGLTEQLSAVRLRYSIGRHWTIRLEAGQGKLVGQTKSGELGGADLVFTVTK